VTDFWLAYADHYTYTGEIEVRCDGGEDWTDDTETVATRAEADLVGEDTRAVAEVRPR
jgi:hypothetical protein